MKSSTLLVLIVCLIVACFPRIAMAQTSPGGNESPQPCLSPPPGADWPCRICYADACAAWKDAWEGCADAGIPIVIADCRAAHWMIYLNATAWCDIACVGGLDRDAGLSESDAKMVVFAQMNPTVFRSFLDVFDIPAMPDPIDPAYMF